jgi:phospholipase C
MYLLSGTSHGLGYNDPIKLAEGMPQRTYFDEFHDQGLSWKIYFDQFPTAMYVIATILIVIYILTIII